MSSGPFKGSMEDIWEVASCIEEEVELELNCSRVKAEGKLFTEITLMAWEPIGFLRSWS